MLNAGGIFVSMNAKIKRKESHAMSVMFGYMREFTPAVLYTANRQI
jgi:hypothetical protein